MKKQYLFKVKTRKNETDIVCVRSLSRVRARKRLFACNAEIVGYKGVQTGLLPNIGAEDLPRFIK